MAPITKIMRKIKQYLCTPKCQVVWELIKHKCIERHIIIYPNWNIGFHGHTHASLLVISVILGQNLTRKHDQPIFYAFRFLNRPKRNYSTINMSNGVCIS